MDKIIEKGKNLKNEKFKANDHRLLNKKMNLFHFSSDIGSSLPVWLGNGTIVKDLIKQYLRKLESEHNFTFITTPILGKMEMYQKSGHLNHYEEYMFPPMQVNEQKLMLRPMTCPHHCVVFRDQNYSYQDLPVRLSENALLFRYEKSGAIHGLERVRQMELKDTHIFLPQDMKVIKQEITDCYSMIKRALKKMGLEIDKIYLSLHDQNNSKKYFNDQTLWTKTEKILEEVLTEMKIKFEKKAGEAAFYGPKIDFQVKSILQHDITVSTIQLDFSLGKKFNLKYRTEKQGKDKAFATPIVIHLGTIGTYERLLALMLEKNKGWLPFWLAPVQMMLFLVNDDKRSKEYFKKIKDFLTYYDLRVKAMDFNKKISENVKIAWEKKIPVQIFIGKKEIEEKTLTFTHHSEPTKRYYEDVYKLLQHCQGWEGEDRS